MRVPIRVDYGVRALVELAPYYGERSVQTSEIAAKQNIPGPYLDQLLSLMNKFGLIKSRRGPLGGHSLAISPEEITLETVMNILEGVSAPLDCLEVPSDCTLSIVCAQREMWSSVEEAIRGVLRSTTISDLSDRQKILIQNKLAVA